MSKTNRKSDEKKKQKKKGLQAAARAPQRRSPLSLTSIRTRTWYSYKFLPPAAGLRARRRYEYG
eukprot:scaffold383249_cov17-Prasinocladus_malaysianus.AAC.1